MDTSEGAPVVVVETAVVGGGGGGGPVVVVEALGAELVVEALLEEDAGGAVEGGGVEAALRGEGDDFERGRDVWGFHGGITWAVKEELGLGELHRIKDHQ